MFVVLCVVVLCIAPPAEPHLYPECHPPPPPRWLSSYPHALALPCTGSTGRSGSLWYDRGTQACDRMTRALRLVMV